MDGDGRMELIILFQIPDTHIGYSSCIIVYIELDNSNKTRMVLEVLSIWRVGHFISKITFLWTVFFILKLVFKPKSNMS